MLAKKGLRPRVSHVNIFKQPNSGIEAIKDRLQKVFDLAMEKAVAHLEDADKYPLPKQPRSLECAFFKFLDNLPRSAKKDAIDKFMPRIRASAKEREVVYGPLKAVNLRSATAVIDQAKKLPMALTSPSPTFVEELRRLVLDDDGRPPEDDAEPPGGGGDGDEPDLHKLRLRLRSLECMDKTNWEIGKDEIKIMGTASDGLGVVKIIKPQNLGKFKKGDVKTFGSGETFALFDTEGSPDLPFRSFDVSMILFERDLGKSDPAEILDSAIDSVTDFLKDPITKFVEEVVKSTLKGALAGALAGTVGGLQGMLIGACVGAALGLLNSLAKKAFGHEIFDPINANLTLTSVTGLIDEDFVTDPISTTFSKHGGIYRLTYDWHLTP